VNNTKRIYCYADVYEFACYLGIRYPGGDWEDAYMNDPIFDELAPLVNRIIKLEESGLMTQEEYFEKITLENKIKYIFDKEKLRYKQLQKQMEKREEQNAVEKIKVIIFTSIFIILTIFSINRILLHFSPTEKEKRRKIREVRQREEKERMEREQEERERALEEMKYQERERYRGIRAEIEAMPQYKQWRDDVLEKCGRKCSVCGSTEGIEVDHRYHSFHSIIKRYGITNTMEAYECRALWDVNNGAPLCKTCHEKTTSHRHWQQHNS
jgi:hypothetical protein